ncbi:Uncharacterised protein [Bordetella pertussis]|nr:Uncharacterised protein [Bordetella pertussis]
MLDARVVDQDIDAAQLGDGAGHQLPHRLALGQVGAVIAHLHAVLAGQPGPQFLDVRRVAESVEHDVGALLRQRAGDPQADAAGGTGDDCNFSFEHDCSPVEWAGRPQV